ncbi:adenine nucleotide alpha hydrolase family protein [Maribellus maritimus]|uniref:hypothetical protein n=1 Tax=Maribellus maritimus TaxID=2870838 RepID=UPI001EEC8615|nr:hypothetical protein [Maribellus maritimus]MCG6187102.1 hypothetical protein [Maribellus maritimus]
MKTIIISDIKSKKDSIIKFGLHLAKHLETEVDVLHPIDSRVHQGEYSAVSDSQSVTPGNTLSHGEIIFREKESVKKDLDKLLSGEASRLNYPLKINVAVEEESIDDAIKNSSNDSDDKIFVISAEPDGNIFHSKNEIRSTVKNNNAICLLVPPGTSFSSLHKILIPVDFHTSHVNTFTGLHSFFKKINPYLIAADVSENSDYAEKELKSQTWMELVKEIIPASKISTSTLEGKNYADTIARYCNRNRPDLLLLSLQKQNPVKQMFSKNDLDKLADKVNVPVLIHYY